MVRKLGKNKAKGPLEHESDFIPLNARGPTSTRGSRQRGGRGRGSSNGQGRAHKPRRSHHSAPVQGHGPGLVTQIISSLQNQPSKGQGRTIQIKSHRGRRVRVSAYQRRPTGHRDDLENASIYLHDDDDDELHTEDEEDYLKNILEQLSIVGGNDNTIEPATLEQFIRDNAFLNQSDEWDDPFIYEDEDEKQNNESNESSSEYQDSNHRGPAWMKALSTPTTIDSSLSSNVEENKKDLFYVDVAGEDNIPEHNSSTSASIALSGKSTSHLIVETIASDEEDISGTDEDALNVWYAGAISDTEDSDDDDEIPRNTNFEGNFQWDDTSDDNNNDIDDMIDRSARGLDRKHRLKKSKSTEKFEAILAGDFSHGYNPSERIGRRTSRSPEWIMATDNVDDDMSSLMSTKTAKSKKKEQKKLNKSEKKQKRLEKKQRRKELTSQRAVNLWEINNTMQEFIMEPLLLSVPLPPMDKLARRTVHQLALQYNLNSKSIGSGNKRHTILSKKRTSQLPETNKVINAIIRNYNKITNYMDPSQVESKKQNKNPNKLSIKGSSASSTGTKSARPRPGTVVGSDVPALSASNLGHQLLAKMGWSPGEALGSSVTNGRVDPVEAVIPMGRRGLGHQYKQA